MLYLDFSYNWNAKLFTFHFSTLRLWQPDRFRVGELYRLRLKVDKRYEEIGNVRLLNQTLVPFNKLSNNMCYTDTGYNMPETKAIIQKMYKEKFAAEGENLQLGYYIFGWETRTFGWFEHMTKGVIKPYDELIQAEAVFQQEGARESLGNPIQVELGL